MIRNIYRAIRKLTPRKYYYNLTPVPQRSKIKIKIEKVKSEVSWISPKVNVEARPNELIVGSIIRNASPYLEDFINHHLRLGAKHIVLIDNNSTDNTREIGLGFGENVSMLSFENSFSQNHRGLRAWMSSTFSDDGWFLNVDLDERFDYPFSDQIPLTKFLEYLNINKYTSVVNQLLDIFPAGEVHTWPQPNNIIRESNWYDNTRLFKYNFEPISSWLGKVIRTNKDIQVYTGGIRLSAFGVHRNLTKINLLRPSKGTLLVTPHAALNSRLADVNGLLLHYSFDKTFPARCEEIVTRNSHWNDSHEYKKYLAALNATGNEFKLKTESAAAYSGMNQLIDEKFIVISDQFKMFVDNLSQGVTMRPPGDFVVK